MRPSRVSLPVWVIVDVWRYEDITSLVSRPEHPHTNLLSLGHDEGSSRFFRSFALHPVSIPVKRNSALRR